MYYFYEGRTARGIGYMSWALLTVMIAVIVLGLASAAMGLLFGVLLQNPLALLGPLVGVVLALCGAVLAELAAAILFLLGFYQVHAGRHEYGLEQTRSMERALIFLIVYIVLTAVTFVFTSTGGLFLGVVSSPATPMLLGTLVLNPVVAFFAGLTLVHSIRTLATPETRSRLRTALVLGVVGACVGPALTLIATTAGTTTVAQYSAGLVAAALAGQGIAAISLFLFWLAYLETRKGLDAGRPAPVLPRIEQAYPWLYRPWVQYPYPYPPANPPPPEPPKT
ncbi:MAG TPA: hypothetical protein VEY12_09940 [Thermoplasmata archaeon]|nr:hypothetical protein [Thermoplasmata archaeon]